MSLHRIHCELRGLWGTLTMGLFWDSLIRPPLVTMSGHIWEYPNGSRCVECGREKATSGR